MNEVKTETHHIYEDEEDTLREVFKVSPKKKPLPVLRDHVTQFGHAGVWP